MIMVFLRNRLKNFADLAHKTKTSQRVRTQAISSRYAMAKFSFSRSSREKGKLINCTPSRIIKRLISSYEVTLKIKWLVLRKGARKYDATIPGVGFLESFSKPDASLHSGVVCWGRRFRYLLT